MRTVVLFVGVIAGGCSGEFFGFGSSQGLGSSDAAALGSADAAPVYCVNPADPCANGVLEAPETDVDCGGNIYNGCRRCDVGARCTIDHDCTTASCVDGRCAVFPDVRPERACDEQADCGDLGLCNVDRCEWYCTSSIQCQQFYGPEHQATISPDGGGHFLGCEWFDGLNVCKWRSPGGTDRDACNGVDDDGDRKVDEGWWHEAPNPTDGFVFTVCPYGGSCNAGQCQLACD